MKAKALICTEKQEFSIEDVALNGPGPDQIAIRAHYSGVSIGTEFALVRNKLSWGPYPICTGYMATGVVEAVGRDIDNFQVGDEVYYRRNDAMEFADGGRLTCAWGTHCTHSVITPNQTHGAAKMIPGAAMDAASMFVLPAVGLFGVDMANPRMGQIALVYGAGLIGQGVIAALANRGCVVIAVDINEKQLDMARGMGADYTINAATQDLDSETRKIAPEGADVVFECTGLPSCIDRAIALCRLDGSFVWQGNYGRAPISISFLPPHVRRLRMFFPCDDGFQPCRRAVVKNMAMGVLKWEQCITHRISYTQAPEMFERINKGEDRDIVGVVINWLE